MPEYVTVFTLRLRRYARLLLIVIADSIWRFRYSSALVIGAGLGGLLAQIAALAVAVLYAQSLEKGEAVTVLGRDFDPRLSIALMVGCGAAVLAALLISAYLIYVSARQAVRVRRKYQQFCAKRAVQRLASELFVWPPPDGRQVETTDIIRLARGDAGFHGWVARLLVEAIVPAFTCLLAVGTLLYLEFFSTLVILGIMAISVIFFYHVNLGAARCSERMEERAGPAGRQMRRLVGALRSAPVVTEAHREQIDAAFSPGGAVPRHLDARDGRMMAMQKSRFISNIFLAVCMFVIIVTLGLGIILEGRGWGRLIVYIVALRHGLVNFRAVAASLTSINRFYPQLRRYRDFLELSAPRRDEAGEPRGEYVLRAPRPMLDESQRRVPLRPGTRIALICSTQLNRYSAGFLIETLLAPDAEAVGDALRSLRLALPPTDAGAERPFAEAAGLPAGMTREDVETSLDGAAASGLIEQLPTDFDRPLAAEAWAQMNNRTKALIGWAGAIASASRWVMVDDGMLDGLEDDIRRCLMSKLADRFTVVVSRDARSAARNDPSVVVVADRGDILGCGSVDWFARHAEAVAALLADAECESANASDGADEIEEDEELM